MTKRIYVVAPGGRSGPGGMCRMVDGMMREWDAAHRRPALVLVDSTGTGPKWRMPGHFAAAVLHLATAGALGRIALLHLHCAERGSVLRKGLLVLLGRALRVPVVLHMHGAEFVPFHDALPSPARATLRCVLRQADAVVVLGSAWQSFFVQRIRLPPAKVTVAHNGVVLPSFSRPRRATCRLLFAGVLGERKGLADLLAALADPRFAGLDWWLDVAGNGDSAPFRRQAEQAGLAWRMRFHGWLPPPEVSALMRAADLLVLPSRNEGLPLAVLEAMAHGLAVIATPVGSVADAVLDRQTGLLVPPGDTIALADALAALVTQPDLRQVMGQAGRERVAGGFTLARQNETLQAIFAPLLAPAPGLPVQP